ncbi:undecaprenyl-diphosphatase UppP [Patescibacteria group bacterium]|nr:undecaprenyl-diphosphatase UppP [Patescibacteria group bacterium]
MNETLSYAILGLVQGLTEFLPVSSSGHLVVMRDLLSVFENGLAVDAVFQLATVLAVIVYFWKDLLNLFYTALYKMTGRAVKPEDERLLLALIIGTIPAFVVGLFLESAMETAFRSPYLVAYTLLVGSLIMLAAEYASVKFATKKELGGTSWKDGLIVGVFQALALVPGMSRSGMTISGGLFLGLSRETAARFGFLLAVPIIAGSGLKKLLELWWGGELVALGAPILVGSVVAFFSGLLAIHFLLMFLRNQPLYIFVAYRVLLAGVILFFL